MRNLIFVFMCLSSFAHADCLDLKVDKNVVTQVRHSAQSLLNPKNTSVVPAGLPDGNYAHRKLEVLATNAGHALVAVYFGTDENKSARFMFPYNFSGKTKTLSPFHVEDLGNNDARFWDAKIKIIDRCKSPEFKITYDSCLACGDGNDLTGNFAWDRASQAWTFVPHQEAN